MASAAIVAIVHYSPEKVNTVGNGESDIALWLLVLTVMAVAVMMVVLLVHVLVDWRMIYWLLLDVDTVMCE